MTVSPGLTWVTMAPVLLTVWTERNRSPTLVAGNGGSAAEPTWTIPKAAIETASRMLIRLITMFTLLGQP